MCLKWPNDQACVALDSFCLESRAGFHTCLQRGGYGKPPYGVSRQELAKAGYDTELIPFDGGHYYPIQLTVRKAMEVAED